MINFYCTNRTKSYKDKVENIINNRKNEILEFFNKDLNMELNFNVYIYDSIEELVSAMKERGFKSMPSYMCACQKDEDNSLNLFEPKDNPSTDEWSKEGYDIVIFHELIHAIEYNLFGTHPEWLTEGIAKYLDGTYKKGIKYLLENYIKNYRIPSMNELEDEFGKREYDSYDYAYLIVCYLLEIYGKEEFLNIISNKQMLESVKEGLIEKSITYYQDKYYTEKSK